jgi:hypothetical protein
MSPPPGRISPRHPSSHVNLVPLFSTLLVADNVHLVVEELQDDNVDGCESEFVGKSVIDSSDEEGAASPVNVVSHRSQPISFQTTTSNMEVRSTERSTHHSNPASLSSRPLAMRATTFPDDGRSASYGRRSTRRRGERRASKSPGASPEERRSARRTSMMRDRAGESSTSGERSRIDCYQRTREESAEIVHNEEINPLEETSISWAIQPEPELAQPLVSASVLGQVKPESYPSTSQPLVTSSTIPRIELEPSTLDRVSKDQLSLGKSDMDKESSPVLTSGWWNWFTSFVTLKIKVWQLVGLGVCVGAVSCG